VFTVAQDVTQVVQACVPAAAAGDLQLRLQSVVITLMQSSVRALTRSDGAASVLARPTPPPHCHEPLLHIRANPRIG